jgi:hypothetical protein
MGHIEDVIPGEPSCETRDPAIFYGAGALGPGSPLRVGRDDREGCLSRNDDRGAR